MDIIVKVHPTSSKGHFFILVAIDYFIKWVEAVPLKKVEQQDVIEFIKEHIIHSFGIPQSITTYQGTMFMGQEVKDFVKDYGIKLLTSSPYYAQANGQVEASNKVLIEDNPREWHHYCQRLYGYGMELKELDEARHQAFSRMAVQKKRIARTYNKSIRKRSFQEGDLVWKEDPFQVYKVLKGNAHWLSSLSGEPHKRNINGRYLKKYHPTMWEIKNNNNEGN
ncbi:uncharacterized protein LOC105641199 [Jatropha curcas]|uniref:uncharacterized protein LOC105641199 n=1 Tax=Jatropha curcas TaxID=180498 RepID=UPI0005FBD7C5|nr:uncharacterized protein LOC105641199 [Jatropha curcas]